ncbi:hypothetical protein GCG21_00695 [Pseudactinotalea sp. HY160]|uniref:hypothetical protein n=1 Tax=Pseudactinotalea sp. HY160 TaxID=2654490 RepID=UPI00128C8AF9|nr:hypothetical protein [Pseudactinotalea sp. HY160]MPV48551.1 hypothetical protein [Pseudactinotalea sp. HY160]
MSFKKRAGALIASIALAAGLTVAVTGPAQAWSSQTFNYSPVQCWGGFVGSSWYSGSTAKASSGGGGGCILTSPKYRAAVRYTWGRSSVVSNHDYALATAGYNSAALGGQHAWYADGALGWSWFNS